jgi:hypothetical protein
MELSLIIGHSKGQRVEMGDLSERSLWIRKEQIRRVQVHLCYKVRFLYSIIHYTVINASSGIKVGMDNSYPMPRPRPKHLEESLDLKLFCSYSVTS